MTVIFEFLGGEPIENVITCMNYKADKAVFFGYADDIRAQKSNTDRFLRKYCKVQSTLFIEVPRDNLQAIEQMVRREIEREINSRNEIFFDLSGGEELILVAFGMLAKEFDAPMHVYDIAEGKLIDFNKQKGNGITDRGTPIYTRFDIDRFIEARGCVINYSMHKDLKSLGDPEFAEDVARLWEITRKYENIWTCFSAFLREHMAPQGDLRVERNLKTINEALNSGTSEIHSKKLLDDILEELAGIGVLYNLRIDDKYRFDFKNELIKACLWDGGSILELHTYQQERNRSDDCKIGVHLDWDGIIHKSAGDDVYNEIDVMCLNGYVPTFISCKNGKMNGGTTLHALYELMTVAEHFGGKYARKVLVTTHPIGDVYMKRAQDMGIEVR